MGEQQNVQLNEVRGKRWLSLYCGFFEAVAMYNAIKTPAPPRPLMHNLMAEIAGALGGRIDHVIIHDFVEDGQYYVAQVVMEGARGLVSVDARATDAISLAICCGAPIFVSDGLLSFCCGKDFRP